MISTETNPVVTARCKKLRIGVIQGVQDKGESVSELAQALDIELKHIVFVGNDVNDLPAFRTVGVAVAVNDAYPEVFDSVRFITTRKGGEGCVREICDILSKINEECSSV